MNRCNWKTHEFEVHGIDAGWNDVGGIYVFAVQGIYGWQAAYIGQASSLKNRLSCHERWDEAYRRGARSVHAMVVPLQLDRDRIERELIAYYQPPMNEKLKQPVNALASLGLAAGGLGLGNLPDPRPAFLKSLGMLDSQASTSSPAETRLAALLGIRVPK